VYCFKIDLRSLSFLGMLKQVQHDNVEGISYIELFEIAEKELQDTSCRGSGGVPQLLKSPKIGGYRGLIESISAVSSRLME